MAKSTYKTNEFIKFPNQYHGDIIVFSHFFQLPTHKFQPHLHSKKDE